jgi:hypothetical protein
MALRLRLSGCEKRLGNEKLELEAEKGDPSLGGGISGSASFAGGSWTSWAGTAEEMSSAMFVRGTKSSSWRFRLVELNLSSSLAATPAGLSLSPMPLLQTSPAIGSVQRSEAKLGRLHLRGSLEV